MLAWTVLLCSKSLDSGQLVYRNVQRFRGGLVFKAHTLVYHSTQGVRVIKTKKTAAVLVSMKVCLTF